MLFEIGDREIEGKVSIIDTYAKRMDSSWRSTDYLLISAGHRGLDGMNLNEFGQNYCVGQRGKFRNMTVNLEQSGWKELCGVLSGEFGMFQRMEGKPPHRV